MYRVVVPVDDDVDRALAEVEYVAGLPGDVAELEVTIAHAYRDDTKQATAASLPDEESPGVSEAVEYLNDAGIPVEIREVYAPVADGIVDLAAEVGADSIVMSGRKRSPAGKALFGSVTQSVILSSPVPVTVVENE
jgi:nucleotide-binding universal stress UspA family protein